MQTTRTTAEPAPATVDITATCAACGQGIRQTALGTPWWHRATGQEACRPTF